MSQVAPVGATRAPFHESRTWRAFVLTAVTVMLAAALYRIPVEIWRLAFEPLGRTAGSDLMMRSRELHTWFGGRPLYGVIESADYPPASYIILYPLLRWARQDVTRLLWVASSILAMTWMSILAVRESGARTPLERAFAALLPLSMYATAATIRIGQMGVHLLPLAVAGILMLARRPASWRRDVLAAGLLVVTLVKPTFSVPFFWLAYYRGGVRFTVAVVTAYVGLTLLSASFQPEPLVPLIWSWLAQSGHVSVGTAHANIYSWLGRAGEDLYLPASLSMLALTGLWTWFNRRADTWMLLAVAAIVARIWSYHRWYDDMLLLLPLIALWRLVYANQASRVTVLVAAFLLVGVWGLGIAPATFLSRDFPLSDLLKSVKTTTWMATLAFLLIHVHASRATWSSTVPGGARPS